MNCVFIRAACRREGGVARTRGFFITVKVADTDQKGVNLLPRVSKLALIPTPSLQTLKRASLQVSVSKFASWLRLRARLFITLASETHAGPWTSHPLALRFWWREGGVVRSVLRHPAGRDGRDDSADLWITYRADVSLMELKNVALAQMTFANHRVLIAQCHSDPPPLLPYHAALMSDRAIKSQPMYYNLEWRPMTCRKKRGIERSHVWFSAEERERRRDNFPSFDSECVFETLTRWRLGWLISQHNEVTRPLKKKKKN